MLVMYAKRKDGDYRHSSIDQSFLFVQKHDWQVLSTPFIFTFYNYVVHLWEIMMLMWLGL